MLANKISWFYDFKGPSAQVDTACSSSLNAVHLACRSIQSGESTMGIVGAANLFFTPESMSPLAHLNFFSADARCYSFDHRANGYSRGEGYGVLVLKPLSAALADGDPIRAVIKATGSNENGRTTGGITKVSLEAQQRLVETTYRSAGLNPCLTRYVEAHAPGTEGDIVEASALASIFSPHRSGEDPLYMGSVKANVGHLEGTSGIASLVKVVLMLERGVIPRLTNFDKLHPRITAHEWNMVFPTENVTWPAGRRQASVNSFGFGGSNAHLVLEDARHYTTRRSPRKHTRLPSALMTARKSFSTIAHSGVSSHQIDISNTNVRNNVIDDCHVDHPPVQPLLLVWSAADKAGIDRIKSAFEDYWLRAVKGASMSWDNLRDLAYTLALRRSRLPWKSFLVLDGSSTETSMQRISKPVRSLHVPQLAFVFTGQGSQWAQMGTQFLQNETFRASLFQCSAYMAKCGASWDLIEEISKPESESSVDDVAHSQPLCTALQIALLDMLRSYGVRPTVVVGHSSGEIAAAYAAGAISTESACKVAFYRGQVVSKHFEGVHIYGMLVVGLSLSAASEILDMLKLESNSPDVHIACINSPTNLTLSGDLEQLRLLKKVLENESVFVRELPVLAPYHSPILQKCAVEYESLLDSLEPGEQSPGSAQMVSSVTTEVVSANDLRTSGYWVTNLVSQVKFASALENVGSRSLATPAIPGRVRLLSFPPVLEIGPYGALRVLVRDTVKSINSDHDLQYFSIMDKKDISASRLFDSVGRMHALGIPVDLAAVNTSAGGSLRCLTDLPSYPFNHSKTYWHESRISRNHRFRKYARHDFLGTRVLDWNPLAPRWRNIIRTLENPWIEDHRIGGALIYPGAGMLAMAIEAAAQYTRDFEDSTVSGFRFKDVSFLSALNVTSAPEGTSTEISLIPSTESIGRSFTLTQFGFSIFVEEEQQWREVCHGTISVEFTEHARSTQMSLELHQQENTRWKQFEERMSGCKTSLSRQKLYQGFRAFGLDFGPTFQTFHNAKYASKGGLAAAGISLRSWTLKGNPAHGSPHFVHPTALDGMLQLPVLALGAGVSKRVPTMVPTKIASAWVSAEGLCDASARVTAVAKAHYQGFRQTLSEVLAFDVELRQPRVVIEGLETIIIKSDSAEPRQREELNYFEVDWKPDLNTLTPKELKSYCWQDVPQDSYRYSDAASQEASLEPLASYLQLLSHWKPGLRVLEVAPVSFRDQSVLLLWTLLKGSEAAEKSQPGIGGHYDVMIPDDSDLSADGPALEAIRASRRTGVKSVSDILRESKSSKGGKQYDLIFTRAPSESTPVTFGRLATVLGHNGRMVLLMTSGASLSKFTDLQGDFEVELQLAGIEVDLNHAQLHDLVVLKKRIVIPELVDAQPATIITAIPELSHSFKSLGRSVADRLIEAGRRYIDIVDWQDVLRLRPHEEYSKRVHLICFYQSYCNDVNTGGSDVYLALKHIVPLSKSVMWVTLPPEDMLGDKEISPSTNAISLGLSRTIRNENPDMQFITLSFDCELYGPGGRMATSRAIAQAFQQGRLIPASYEPEYHFGNLRGLNVLQIPRMTHTIKGTPQVSDPSDAVQTIKRPFRCSGHQDLILTVTSPGLLDTLIFVPDPSTETLLRPHEILITPAYAGLNFLDVLTALGRIPQISTLGVEAAGTVLTSGSESDLRPGDRVAVLTDGTLRSQVRADYRSSVRIPNSLSFRDAASIPGTACTAYRALLDIARLEAGETVLIHAGAGATGQMAIQVSQHIGAEIFVTVGSERKRKLVSETYEIPNDHILHSRDASFVPALKRMTNGRGVDVVLNSLAGALLDAAWTEIVAPFGRWVELGKRDILDNNALSMRPLLQNVTFSCVDLSGIWRQRPKMMRRLLENVFNLVAEGVIRPVSPVGEFGISNVEGAFRSLQNGQDGGKVVVNMDASEQVMACQTKRPSWTLRPDRSYLIVGGFGGLGKHVAKWLVCKGAKALILISRSGVDGDGSKEAFLQELRDTGCVVEVMACNVADTKSLQATLDVCGKTMPLIAGCIQASMVLRVSKITATSVLKVDFELTYSQDKYLKDMTLNDWSASTDPKIRGSLNLDCALPEDLDFFVLFSSIVGVVGGAGQGNYSAGNAFQDALARQRVLRGRKAVSLDLGMIVDEGAVAEDESLSKVLESFGWYQSMTTHDLEALLEKYCDPSLPVLSMDECQVVCGIRSPSALRAKGFKQPGWMTWPMFQSLHLMENSAAADAVPVQDTYQSAFKAAPSLEQAGCIVADALIAKLSTSLGVPTSDIDPSRPVHMYGVDSLIAVELRNWFTNEIKADVAVLHILGNTSVDALGLIAAEKSLYTEALRT